MAKKQKEEQEKSYGVLQWILLMVIIPTLFTVVVAFGIATLLDINVFEESKKLGEKVPVIGNVIGGSGPSEEELKLSLSSLQGEMKNKEAEVTKLQTQIDRQLAEIDQLLLDKKQLNIQIEELSQLQEENKRAFDEIVSTYETMSAKSAAGILVEMNEDEALTILSKVKPSVLSKILEKMPAENAAVFTEKLAVKTAP
ncbi:hypothetical protein Q75_06165 [Bacillus coahuilensis p1.1.43]|uniref:Magnesium transporter MgtE intracellular domain-containing protein n=1 Tax=Bacillus coahuilensis p1.1.43 TaxID=1150625 RepID=A0A147K9R5_9BACI|nr:MotE family protein [Bacillus coahuilensis]KUP07111.1 hypothetical protein Q75_06165 [Bacillus coahuilensis p1.1.43]